MNRFVHSAAIVVASVCCACSTKKHMPVAVYERNLDVRPAADLAEFELTRVSMTTTLDLASSLHRAWIELEGTVRVTPSDPAIGIDPSPVIELCILSDGTDITRLHDSNTPGQRPRRVNTEAGGWPTASQDGSMRSSSRFLNLPPRSWTSIRLLRGYFPAARPTTIETVRIDYANDSVTVTDTGWRVEVQGIEQSDPNTTSTSGRVVITREGTASDSQFSPPRLLRAELLNEDNEVVRSSSSISSRPRPDGITIDIPNAVMRMRSNEPTKPPVAIRIEFVSEIERLRIPFEYRDILLTR